jgi:hypothetical protein
VSTEKKKRGPRLPFGQLGGVWTELAQTLRGLKDGTITDVENAKARVYTLSMMLGVVDRLLEQRALGAMQEEIASLRAAISGEAVIEDSKPPAARATLPAHAQRSADA